MQLYKRINYIGNRDSIKVLYGPNNTFTECYPNGELRSWQKLLSGYYIKLSQDWVPTEVIHYQLAPPLELQPLEEELVDEQRVQRWLDDSSEKCSSKPSKQQQSNSFSPSRDAARLLHQQKSKHFQSSRDQSKAERPKPIPLAPPSTFQHSH